MKMQTNRKKRQANVTRKFFLTAAAMTALLLVVPAFATEYGGADEKVCGFLDSIQGLLTMASIAVVTVAVIFAGYQIAFAHKRISDVAPILIGGLLIGAAGQIASMVMPEQDSAKCSTSGGTPTTVIVVPFGK
ncbi:type IV secretion system protein VirB2 [Pseudoxanthomonas sp. GM95]|uniref:TrbC/VirB2 family protein n=1 Tax=Pseudoxanthomonas sp. GM95 TaxID=1881043 RepID=UPI0008B34DE7|nr:TrbC/VirB2 family protein [Pseudoxanthomonas sp. GM95]SEK69885.1 type IV secretion system protein VirB2 [Pseudoxanthomonas sp. GM95]